MIKVPTPQTLKKYGLTEDDWREILESQNGVCAVCEKEPKSGIMHIEHEHVRGWKKMPAFRRRQYVRGLVCQFCNRFVLARTLTLRKAKRIVWYLKRYKLRDETWMQRFDEEAEV